MVIPLSRAYARKSKDRSTDQQAMHKPGTTRLGVKKQAFPGTSKLRLVGSRAVPYCRTTAAQRSCCGTLGTGGGNGPIRDVQTFDQSVARYESLEIFGCKERRRLRWLVACK